MDVDRYARDCHQLIVVEKAVPIDCQSDVERLATRVVELLARADKAESMLSDIASSEIQRLKAKVAELEGAIRGYRDDTDEDRMESTEHLYRMVPDERKEGG